MRVHVISNAVPTPEEMGQLLGLSSERVAAVRSIMGAPEKTAHSGRASRALTTGRKKPLLKSAKKSFAKK